MDATDLDAALTQLQGVSLRTPAEESRWLSNVVGVPVWMKCENLQRAGSFKIRGAYVRIARLSPQERERGVVAASAGNHAQGVALAASLLGTNATIFMPEGASLPKISATRSYGADIEFYGAGVTEALQKASEFAERTSAILIHPFDHADIIAGQGTVALEIMEQVPEAATIVVPLGGGGLTAGICLLRSRRPDVRVVGVQATEAAAYPASIAQGKPVRSPLGTTMADGIAVAEPGPIPFEILNQYLDDVLTVSEESLSKASIGLMERAKLLVEPSGAAGVAAMLDNPGTFEGPTVTVLSGGNIDPLVLMEIIRHGLAASGRFLTVHVRIKDRPGELNRLLEQLARQGVNVHSIIHDRSSAALGVHQVDVALEGATRGLEHQHEILQTLRSCGFQVLDAGRTGSLTTQ